MPNTVADLLEEMYLKYNTWGFIENDPIESIWVVKEPPETLSDKVAPQLDCTQK